MRQIWTDNEHCILDGVPFEYHNSNYATLHTTPDKVWVLKNREFFARYEKLLGGWQPERVLELGFFEGGSAFLFADRWPEVRIAAVDMRAPNPAVPALVERFGFADRLSFHYRMSQDDPAVLGVIDDKLGGSPDLVIDDASHQFKHTRASFELIWPRVAPGGLYVVEDWAWAHWPAQQKPDHNWSHMKALTNILFELAMATGTNKGCIAGIHVEQSYFAVRRAPGKLPEPFSLSEHYAARGKQLATI